MAAYVTAGSDNVNVKSLKKVLTDAMQELSKKKTGKTANVTTHDDLTSMFTTFIQETVGMHNYFNQNLKETNQKLEEAQDKIKTLEESRKSDGEELIKLKKELVSTKLELERNQQVANRDTFKLCGVKEPTNPAGGHEDK